MDVTNFTLAKVSSTSQVTLPKEVRDKLGIGRGDFLMFAETDDGGISLMKAQVVGVMPQKAQQQVEQQNTEEQYGQTY